MANNYVVTAIAAVVGSRILYILTNLSEFDSLGSLFAMRRGGLVAYGGFLGGLAGSYFYLRSYKIPLLPWADVAVPSLASGLMITRIGCYLFGCDFGQPLKDGAPAWLKKLGTFPRWPDGTLDQGGGSPAFAQHTKLDWIANHPDLPRLTSASTASHPVHPTQLYESLVGAFLLVLLLWARRKQKFRGQIFLLFFFSYGVLRYLLEVLRDDAERGNYGFALPEHILIPLGLVLMAIGWVVGFSKAVENVTVQRVSQVVAFVPAVVLFFMLQPAPGTFGTSMQYSTSQLIGLISAVLASVAFAILYKAALAHPKQAMALGLPPEFGGPAPEPAPADEEEEPRRRPKKTTGKTRKTKGKGTKKAAAAPKTEAAEETKKDEPESGPEPGDGDDGGGDEPLKAS
jgi:phosphatidylglycerol:prolipoprotein diacylglycerol transferase